jgi:hypothetical protein
MEGRVSRVPVPGGRTQSNRMASHTGDTMTAPDVASQGAHGAAHRVALQAHASGAFPRWAKRSGNEGEQ